MTISELKQAFNFAYKVEYDTIYCVRANTSTVNCQDKFDENQTLTAGAYLLLSPHSENKVRIWSLNEPEPMQFTVNEIIKSNDCTWLKYPLDIFKSLFQGGTQLKTGLNIFIWGNIPDKAEITAQEFLQTITAYALNNQFGTTLCSTMMDNTPKLQSLIMYKCVEPKVLP